MQSYPRYLTVPEVAEIFRCSRRYVYEQIELKRLPAVRFGKKILVSQETVDLVVSGALTVGGEEGGDRDSQ